MKQGVGDVALVKVYKSAAKLARPLPLAGAGDKFPGDFNANEVGVGKVASNGYKQSAIAAAFIYNFTWQDSGADVGVFQGDDLIVPHEESVGAVVAAVCQAAGIIQQRIAPQSQNAAGHVGEVMPELVSGWSHLRANAGILAPLLPLLHNALQQLDRRVRLGGVGVFCRQHGKPQPVKHPHHLFRRDERHAVLRRQP